MDMPSPLGDTVSVWNLELEYWEPFSTGKVMWKKTAPAPAHSSAVPSGVCTIQSCCLRTWSHWISISQQQTILNCAIQGVSKVAEKICICICLSIHTVTSCFVSLFTNTLRFTNIQAAKQSAIPGRSIYHQVKFHQEWTGNMTSWMSKTNWIGTLQRV